MIVRRTGLKDRSVRTESSAGEPVGPSSTALCVEPSSAHAATSPRSTPFAASFFSDSQRAVHQSAGSCSLQPGWSWYVTYSVDASPANEPSVPSAVTLHPPVP